MVRLYATITELWPDQAKDIMKRKGMVPRKLRKRFSKIVFPWCKGYNDYRFFYELQQTELPLFVIVVQTTCDAIHAMNLLREYPLTTRIINGRHSTIVINPDYYIDVSSLNSMSLTSTILRVGGGATQGQVYQYLFEKSCCDTNYPVGFCNMFRFHQWSTTKSTSLAFPGGSQGSVGVTGVTTNGGLGSFKRTLGLGCDYVTKYAIALPPTQSQPSRIVECSVDSPYHDLFWALNGCVALNFGIVLHIEYQVVVIESILSYQVFFLWKDACQVIQLWQQTAPSRPYRFNEDLNTYTFREGDYAEIGINISGQYVVPSGQTREEAETIVRTELASLLTWSTSFQIQFSSYSQTVQGLSSDRVYYPFSYQRGVLSSLIVDPQQIVEHMNKAFDLEGLHLYLLELLGGKISDRTSEATAYFPRQAKYWYDMSCFYRSSLQTCQNKQWFEEAYEFTYVPDCLENTLFPGLPLNGLSNHRQAYYGSNVQRLLEIKKKYDPEGYLRFPSGLVE